VTDSARPAIDAELLEILACPIGLGKLELEGDRLVCARCGVRFRIEEGGIPNMLIDEAELPEGVASAKELPCWAEREKRSPQT
jgi:uncharacterized protein YbaR (Trm112 family)